MANKFARILAFMGLASDTEPVTEAHLQTANDKIAQLEQAKSDAEASLATVTDERDQAKTALATAEGKVTETEGKLAILETEATTLRAWKKSNKADDGRTEDETNKLDGDDEAPKASWEVAASKHIADTKKRLGEK